MDWVIWLVVGAAVLAVAVAVAVRRTEPDADEDAHADAGQATGLVSAPSRTAEARQGIEVRQVDTTALELWLTTMDLRLATIESRRLPDIRDRPRAPAWVARTVETVAREVPELRVVLRTIRADDDLYVVRFPAEITKAIRDGSAQLMKSNGQTLSVAVDAAKRQTRSHARVMGTLKEVGGGIDPVSLTASAVAAVAAYEHQRWLENTLNGIDSAVAALADRACDDDHGRLMAALAHARRTEDFLLNDEIPPDYFRTGVVRALADVEAIYYSRRRLAQRFVDALESHQIDHEVERGERTAWAKGIDKAFGDPARFAAEMMVYAHAMAARTRIATTESVLLAADGAPGPALRLLEDAADELNDDFHDLSLRIAALSRAKPPKKLRDLQPAVETLHAALDGDVAPTLPPRTLSVAETVMHLPLPDGRRADTP